MQVKTDDRSDCERAQCIDVFSKYIFVRDMSLIRILAVRRVHFCRSIKRYSGNLRTP
jgi:hypothetical protein